MNKMKLFFLSVSASPPEKNKIKATGEAISTGGCTHAMELAVKVNSTRGMLIQMWR